MPEPDGAQPHGVSDVLLNYFTMTLAAYRRTWVPPDSGHDLIRPLDNEDLGLEEGNDFA